MNIAIDISPLKSGHFLQHRVRGTGFYIDNLKRSLMKYFPDNKYTFFTRGEKLSKDIDLVHYPYFEPFFLTLPLVKNRKSAITIHDLTPLVFSNAFPRGIRGEIKWQIQKKLLERADVIITDSECSKKDITRYTGIPDKKINVVYLAAGEQFKRIKNQESRIRDLKTKYGLPERFVLYVGDVTWNKNLPRLIEAIKKINATLVMTGRTLASKDFDRNNPWNQDLVRVQELAKDDKRIIRLDFVPTGDLVFLYNMATVFAMPSLYEGFGLPILEAMSCGCPVVTSKEGSLEEIAKDAAFYVDAYNVESIAKGIKQLFASDSLRREFSKKGLEQAKKFSWKKTAEDTLKVYKKVL